jgi:hypothetical protein
MSFDDDRKRFAQPRSIAKCAGWQRWMAQRMWISEAWKCRANGDEAGFERYMAKATGAPTMSLARGIRNYDR